MKWIILVLLSNIKIFNVFLDNCNIYVFIILIWLFNVKLKITIKINIIW